MIVGQDQKALAAVVVPDMDYKAYHPPTLRGELLGEVQWASLLTTSPDDFAALMLVRFRLRNPRNPNVTEGNGAANAIRANTGKNSGVVERVTG
jgi:hypothetical protein